MAVDHYYASRFGPVLVLLVGCAAVLAGSMSRLNFVLETTILVVAMFVVVFRAVCMFPFSGGHVPLKAVIAVKRSASVLQALPLLALVILGLNWLSYVAASTAFPIRDAELAWLDCQMGFQWIAFMKALDEYPTLVEVLRMAYRSLPLQMAAIPVILMLSGLYRRFDWFLAAFIPSAMVAILLSALVPTHGPAQLNASPTAFENLRFGGAWVRPIVDGLRDGTLSVITAEAMKGIVTFPSMHAALAVINTAAFRPLPLVFWPFLVVNALMIPATVTEGGHYLTDVVVGIGIALVAMRLAPTLMRVLEPVQTWGRGTAVGPGALGADETLRPAA